MKTWWRRWGLSLAKWLLALAILVGVGRQFFRDLSDPRLTDLQVSWPWIILSALLYLIGLGFSAGYWFRLLHIFGEKPSVVKAFRAYYIGHLGKYVPGKAWALAMRGSLVGPEVRFGVAVLTAFYEVLTTMATGALVAAVVFALWPPDVAELRLPPMLTGLLLLGLVGVPLLPGVFNLIVGRLARRFQTIDALQVPRLRGRTLAEGILTIGIGWGVLGASVWAMLAAVLPNLPEFALLTWLQCAAVLGLAYVAGFLAVMMPSGVVVREYILLLLLPWVVGPEPSIALAVLLLRAAWTAAELVVAALLWIWRH